MIKNNYLLVENIPSGIYSTKILATALDISLVLLPSSGHFSQCRQSCIKAKGMKLLIEPRCMNHAPNFGDSRKLRNFLTQFHHFNFAS